MTRPRELIYVPGIWPKPTPERHRQVLHDCLLEGIRRAEPRLAAELAGEAAFPRLVPWGHLFYDEYRDFELDRAAVEALRAVGASGRDVIAPALRTSQRLRRRLNRVGDQYPALIWLIAGAKMRRSLAEGERYFGNAAGAATSIRLLVAQALREAWRRDASVLLMGHSLGSVIAYDTLCELRGEGTVDLFVTLGSPLGNRYVKERLLSHRGSRLPRYPTNIRHWRNLSALGEMTSLERSMSEEFADMRRQGLVQSLEDRVDLVNPFVGPEGLNVHRCYGYFVNEVTGATIAEWWHGAFDAPGAAPRAVQ